MKNTNSTSHKGHPKCHATEAKQTSPPCKYCVHCGGKEDGEWMCLLTKNGIPECIMLDTYCQNFKELLDFLPDNPTLDQILGLVSEY